MKPTPWQEEARPRTSLKKGVKGSRIQEVKESSEMTYEELKNWENPVERKREENASSLEPLNPGILESLRLKA